MPDTGYLKDNLIGMIPEEMAEEIIKIVTQGSALLRLSTVQEMKTDKKKIPVLTDGPGAYWVGEGERIETSTATWIYPELEAKKLAVIIPVTKEKMEDPFIEVLEELKPYVGEAFYQSIDAAGFFGTGPFVKHIYGEAASVGNVYTQAANEKFDIAVSEAMGTVEERGYDVDGWAASRGVKKTIRSLRDANGNKLFVEGINGSEFYNVPIDFCGNQAWDVDKASMIGGMFARYSLVGMRADIEYQILTEATLQNVIMPDGKPLSLAENDMIALKATMRMGYLCVKPEAFCVVAPNATKLGTLTVTSAAGTEAGNTALSVTPTLGEGNNYVYKVGDKAATPAYGHKLTKGWTQWNGTDDITEVTGKVLTLAEVSGLKEARKVGSVTVTAKA